MLPEPARTGGGYRDYDGVALERLAFVRSAQAAGLTVAEIRGVIAIRDDGRSPCSHVLDLLDAKSAAVTRQLAELRSLKRELNRLKERARAFDANACDERSICQLLAASLGAARGGAGRVMASTS